MYFAVRIYVKDLLCASKPGSKTVVIYDCSEYCQVVQMLPRNEQRLEFKTHFSKAVEHRQTHPVKIIDRGNNRLSVFILDYLLFRFAKFISIY